MIRARGAKTLKGRLIALKILKALKSSSGVSACISTRQHIRDQKDWCLLGNMKKVASPLQFHLLSRTVFVEMSVIQPTQVT